MFSAYPRDALPWWASFRACGAVLVLSCLSLSLILVVRDSSPRLKPTETALLPTERHMKEAAEEGDVTASAPTGELESAEVAGQDLELAPQQDRAAAAPEPNAFPEVHVEKRPSADEVAAPPGPFPGPAAGHEAEIDAAAAASAAAFAAPPQVTVRTGDSKVTVQLSGAPAEAASAQPGGVHVAGGTHFSAKTPNAAPEAPELGALAAPEANRTEAKGGSEITVKSGGSEITVNIGGGAEQRPAAPPPQQPQPVAEAVAEGPEILDGVAETPIEPPPPAQEGNASLVAAPPAAAVASFDAPAVDSKDATHIKVTDPGGQSFTIEVRAASASASAPSAKPSKLPVEGHLPKAIAPTAAAVPPDFPAGDNATLTEELVAGADYPAFKNLALYAR